MSRVSRKIPMDSELAKTPVKVYSVGIYARLSVDSHSAKNESIDTQIQMAKEYIKGRAEFILYDCYSDLGKTGTNFERPEFGRLMQDVRLRRVNCIIVKDLSRFGRNYIEMGNYLEKIFPFLGVRFISITDQYDTVSAEENLDTLGINLKNLTNEMYAKDISTKVKKSKQMQWEQGSFTGGISPYGYKIERIDKKNCLIVEDNTAVIVKKLYDLFLTDKNLINLKVWLYEQKVHRPRDYRKTGFVYQTQGELLREWDRTTIKSILQNPIYIGCLVQGRTCGAEYLHKARHDVNREDWSIKEHTHEPIVSEDVFYRVAAKFERQMVYSNKKGFSKTVPAEEDVLKGILFCGECKKKMSRISSKKTLSSGDIIRTYAYYCGQSVRIDDRKCEEKYISYETLKRIVAESIQHDLSLSNLSPQKLIKKRKEQSEKDQQEQDRLKEKLEQQISVSKVKASRQYLRYKMGEISQSAFLEGKQDSGNQIAEWNRQIAECRRIEKEQKRVLEDQNHLLKALCNFNKEVVMDGDLLRSLIERIDVYPGKRVEIIFRFLSQDYAGTCGRDGQKNG